MNLNRLPENLRIPAIIIGETLGGIVFGVAVVALLIGIMFLLSDYESSFYTYGIPLGIFSFILVLAVPFGVALTGRFVFRQPGLLIYAPYGGLIGIFIWALFVGLMPILPEWLGIPYIIIANIIPSILSALGYTWSASRRSSSTT